MNPYFSHKKLKKCIIKWKFLKIKLKHIQQNPYQFAKFDNDYNTFFITNLYENFIHNIELFKIINKPRHPDIYGNKSFTFEIMFRKLYVLSVILLKQIKINYQPTNEQQTSLIHTIDTFRLKFYQFGHIYFDD